MAIYTSTVSNNDTNLLQEFGVNNSIEYQPNIIGTYALIHESDRVFDLIMNEYGVLNEADGESRIKAFFKKVKEWFIWLGKKIKELWNKFIALFKPKNDDIIKKAEDVVETLKNLKETANTQEKASKTVDDIKKSRENLNKKKEEVKNKIGTLENATMTFKEAVELPATIEYEGYTFNKELFKEISGRSYLNIFDIVKIANIPEQALTKVSDKYNYKELLDKFDRERVLGVARSYLIYGEGSGKILSEEEFDSKLEELNNIQRNTITTKIYSTDDFIKLFDEFIYKAKKFASVSIELKSNLLQLDSYMREDIKALEKLEDIPH